MSTLLTRLEELQQKAGARGYTFAGRHVQHKSESLEEILTRLPIAELESAGFTRVAPILGSIKNPTAQAAKIAQLYRNTRSATVYADSVAQKAEERRAAGGELSPLSNFLRILRESPLAGIIHALDSK